MTICVAIEDFCTVRVSLPARSNSNRNTVRRMFKNVASSVEADFQAWRGQRDCTSRKNVRLDACKRRAASEGPEAVQQVMDAPVTVFAMDAEVTLHYRSAPVDAKEWDEPTPAWAGGRAASVPSVAPSVKGQLLR